jgi:ribosomal protein L18E
LNYNKISHLLKENKTLVIVGTLTGLEKFLIWHTNYLTMLDVWEKVAGNGSARCKYH